MTTAHLFDYDGPTNQVAGRCANSPGRGPHLARGEVMSDATCSVEDCTRRTHARGWCERHYNRWRRHGDPTATMLPGVDGYPTAWIESLIVVSESGCWEWQGRIGSHGYGCVGREGLAHRITYERFVGPIPEGLHIDHLCRNRVCCNPAHLEPVTLAENNRRSFSPTAINARKTHCIRGHEFTPENTYVKAAGKRECRTCRRDRDAAAKAGA